MRRQRSPDTNGFEPLPPLSQSRKPQRSRFPSNPPRSAIMSSLTLVQGQFFLPAMIRVWRHFLTGNVQFEFKEYSKVPSVFLSLNDWRIKHDVNEQCFGCGERATIFEVDDRGEQRYRMNWCTDCNDEIRRTIREVDNDMCDWAKDDDDVERNLCGRPVARTCNMSTEDCCRYTGRCYCGRVTPQGSLECVDCRDYRGWFR